MRFIILILSLALFRYMHVGALFSRFKWFPSYVDEIQKVIRKLNIGQGYLAQFAIIFPIFIVFALIYWLFESLLFHFVGFLLSGLYFIYCLDPQNSLIKTLKQLKEKKELIDLDSTHSRDLSAYNILKNLFTDYFAISFWFVVLGPLAAVAYRLFVLVVDAIHAKKLEASYMKAQKALEIIHWLPARVFVLGFSLMGNFITSFDVCIQKILNVRLSSSQLIHDAAFAALDLNPHKEKADLLYAIDIYLLVERTFVLFVVLYALVIIGMLLA